MQELHSLDGELVTGVPPEFALHPFGVFTTFVVVDGGVLGLREHLARLQHDAAVLWDHSLDETRLLQTLRRHVSLLTGPASVRITLYPERFSLATPSDAHGCRILITSRPTTFPPSPPADLSVATAEFVRDLPEVKSTSILGQLRRRREAQLAGYDDVLFRRGANVLEGATWSVICWRDGEVATPSDSVLPSTTATHIGRIAAELGWTFRVRPIVVAELLDADLVQAASVNYPARAINRIDGVSLEPGRALLATIAESYAALPMDRLGD